MSILEDVNFVRHALFHFLDKKQKAIMSSLNKRWKAWQREEVLLNSKDLKILETGYLDSVELRNPEKIFHQLLQILQTTCTIKLETAPDQSLFSLRHVEIIKAPIELHIQLTPYNEYTTTLFEREIKVESDISEFSSVIKQGLIKREHSLTAMIFMGPIKTTDPFHVLHNIQICDSVFKQQALWNPFDSFEIKPLQPWLDTFYVHRKILIGKDLRDEQERAPNTMKVAK